MGKRYTREEIDQIQAMVTEGLTDRQIATKLNRSEDGIRNIRHRTKLKANATKSLQLLLQDERELHTRVSRLQRDVTSLSTRREKIQAALRVEEQALNQKLQNALIKLKDEKPELFHITAEEQLAKLRGELTGAFFKWLISE